MGHMVTRANIVVKGIVQGVGFRPFVFNLAEALGLKGWVTNTAEGVLIDVEGDCIPSFIQRLRSEAPPLSQITDVSVTSIPLHGYSDFAIHTSTDQAGSLPFTLISPDVSICEDCLREMLDPADRRYLYPFINCTNCGPRYSITRSIPYDRPNTTMAGFTMCPDCLREYQDPRNRRFHAQPNACPACGPQVEFKVQSSEYRVRGNKAVPETIKLLLDGGIVAIKGIGGFHIACDAANDDAVRRLRERKRKSNKPFAVMVPSVEYAERFCEISESEKTILLSNRRPIVLLRKKRWPGLSDSVSPGNNLLGVMLPYTPLHYLLFYHPVGTEAGVSDPHFAALVMTSGNLAEEPIVHDNDEAIKKLAGVADGFLLHDRDIFMRVDDSVVRVQSSKFRVQSRYNANPSGTASSSINSELRTLNSELSFIRRSRGYAPDPIMLHDEGPEVLGCGADLKNTFTLTKGKFAIPSQHIGDMENYETLKFYEECLDNLKHVYRVNPVAIAHDLHPGYLSTRWALEYMEKRSPSPVPPLPAGERAGVRGNSELRTLNSELLFAIQHHYAHIGSVMAEHGLTGKVIGVAFDGTGYGTDGNLWGGEFLVADINGFERAGQFRYVPLPGGEAAIREPWRTAVSYVMDSVGERAGDFLERCGFLQKYGKETVEQVKIVARSREFSPLSSGAGRLFDAVSALIGICDRNTFEGEAAMALEAAIQEGIEDEYHVEFKTQNGHTFADFSPMIVDIIHDMSLSIAKEMIAAKFHNTVASVIRNVVRSVSGTYGLKDVALSGGTFQNQYLMRRTVRLLSADGMNVYTNGKVPCNDACISLGQAYLVRERLKKASS
jgi:hydrogenase maturation protein HypF